MKTANLAIVFTDIKGFTERTSGQTLMQNEQLLQQHAALLEPIFKAFGGRIVKSIGDAYLVTFESPTQAVLSGVAIQDRLWEYNRTASAAERIDVRVAVNVGEVRVESGDVFGEPVNIAARVEGIADAGEVFFTEAVYLSMNKAEIPSEEVGAFELKGIPGKIRVFKVPHAPYRVAAPVPGAVDPSGHAPPFGNLGLSRMGAPDLASRASTTAAALGERAAELASRGAQLGEALVERTNAALSARSGRRRGILVSAALGAIALAVLAALALRPSPEERAVEAVRGSPAEERDQREEAARKLIARQAEPERSFLFGKLEEALGEPANAARSYRAAAAKGHGSAKDRLVALLESPVCRARVEAARAVGDLKLDSARGQLESLAEKGGAGEDGIPLIGCNSRRAAEEALRRLP